MAAVRRAERSTKPLAALGERRGYERGRGKSMCETLCTALRERAARRGLVVPLIRTHLDPLLQARLHHGVDAFVPVGGAQLIVVNDVREQSIREGEGQRDAHAGEEEDEEGQSRRQAVQLRWQGKEEHIEHTL